MKENLHNDPLFNTFKGGLANHEVTPPAHIWDNIQKALDEQEGGAIAPAAPWWSQYWKFGAAAIVLLSLAGGLIIGSLKTGTDFGMTASEVEALLNEYQGNNMANNNNTPGNTHQDNNIVDHNDLLVDDSNAQNNANNSGSANNDRVVNNNQQPNTHTPNNTATNSNPLAAGNSNVDGHSAPDFEMKNIPVYSLSLLSENAIENSSYEVLFNAEKVKGPEVSENIAGSKGFYFGPLTGINNTYHILKDNEFQYLGVGVNPDVSQAVEYTTDFSPGFGYAYGVSLGYDINHKFGLELDVIHSISKQKFTKTEYNVNGEALLFERAPYTLKQSYLETPVIFKYKWTKETAKGKINSLNYLFGLNYRYLLGTNANDFEASTQALPNKHELGFLIGLEQEWGLGNNMLFSLGARSTITGNAGSFPLIINDENDSPYNVSVGVTAAFKFRTNKRTDAK